MDNSDSVKLALRYAERGWPVLPLNGKRPAIKGGVHSASTEQDFIRKSFANGSNIGIQTGKTSGIVAIDIDPRNGGDETLSKLLGQYGELPQTLQSITGGGGFHLLFKHPGIQASS
ncbi:bifunctional DNA primase/polymerase [Solemya elarraichensis gill symbiont]|uniref:DNA primase/polymerase bifunctional N-terminal domain-containing protein n=1 Tax=Solemya elarraichensis gill symbiont TaxID=1918949 RepID=A0A1T2L599_9GAMM|nr:bifunctional DNA primase/polymerase [Solemya elarraichensis gill symbiont]OOZ40234.1 hypothetical protein BOW52_06130 [Solemya elarraichensis gill symbiont]